MSGVEIKHKSQMKKILASSKILHCQNPPNSSLQKPPNSVLRMMLEMDSRFVVYGC